MNDNYADFAELYDDTIDTDNLAKIDLIYEAINRYNPAAKTMLEIACGTGNILAGFPDFERFGLDLSPNMLTMAAAKLPDVPLLQGDMTDFDLGRRFDVILCMFNSINHLLEFEQWQQTFACVAEHLAPGSLFILDANTPSYPERRVDEIGAVEHSGSNEILATMTWQRPGVYQWNISINDEPGQHHVTIPEAVFPLQKIENALKEHFKIVKKQPDSQLDRVYYTCQV